MPEKVQSGTYIFGGGLPTPPVGKPPPKNVSKAFMLIKIIRQYNGC